MASASETDWPLATAFDCVSLSIMGFAHRGFTHPLANKRKGGTERVEILGCLQHLHSTLDCSQSAWFSHCLEDGLEVVPAKV